MRDEPEAGIRQGGIHVCLDSQRPDSRPWMPSVQGALPGDSSGSPLRGEESGSHHLIRGRAEHPGDVEREDSDSSAHLQSRT